MKSWRDDEGRGGRAVEEQGAREGEGGRIVSTAREKERGERGAPVLNLLSHRQKRLLDIRRVLRTRLQEANPNLIRKLLRNIVIDNLLGRQVALVTDEELVDPLAGVTVNLLEPLLDVGEGVRVGNVVDDDDAVSAAVVGRGDGAETFLTGRVPLQAREEKGSVSF